MGISNVSVPVVTLVRCAMAGVGMVFSVVFMRLARQDARHNLALGINGSTKAVGEIRIGRAMDDLCAHAGFFVAGVAAVVWYLTHNGQVVQQNWVTYTANLGMIAAQVCMSKRAVKAFTDRNRVNALMTLDRQHNAGLTEQVATLLTEIGRLQAEIRRTR